MDILSYLWGRERQLNKQGGHMRNPHVFDASHIPKQPEMREEMKPLIRVLSGYEKKEFPRHLMFTGRPGSGKTLGALYARELFKLRGLNVLYVNCRTSRSNQDVLAHLLDDYGGRVTFGELQRQFLQMPTQKTVVILDGIEALVRKEESDVLLQFLAWPALGSQLILLSDTPKSLGALDDLIQGIVRPDRVYVNPYTIVEIEDILRGRAKAGLKGVKREVLTEIATRTYRQADSDVRVALKTLYHWAIEPYIDLGMHFRAAQRHFALDAIAALDDHDLLMLRAVSCSDGTKQSAYGIYKRLCREHKVEVSNYDEFLDALAELRVLDLVRVSPARDDLKHGRAIRAACPQDVLDEVWALRFGKGNGPKT